jgi:hypothetical protein
MSQKLVPTLPSVEQLIASTGGIDDVGYLPRANKVYSKKRDSFTRYPFLAEFQVAESLNPRLSL